MIGWWGKRSLHLPELSPASEHCTGQGVGGCHLLAPCALSLQPIILYRASPEPQPDEEQKSCAKGGRLEMSAPPTPNAPTVVADPASAPSSPVKPTSRARTYKIPANSNGPNNADAQPATAHNSADDQGPPFLWATREIAALEFLMNCPLAAEKDIVRQGLSGGRFTHRGGRQRAGGHGSIPRHSVNYASEVEAAEEEADNSSFDASRSQRNRTGHFDFGRNLETLLDDEVATAVTGTESSIASDHHRATAVQHHVGGGRWWDRLVSKDKRFFSAANQQAQRRAQLEMEERELERPTESPAFEMFNSGLPGDVAGQIVAGRRLDGRDSISVAIPNEFRNKPHKTVARKVALREWERGVALGMQTKNNRSNSSISPPLLDGRVFFSAKKSYPAAIFTTIKYEPKKEEKERKRRELEELGQGGTKMEMPERDWRGISYRALLPQKRRRRDEDRTFNRLFGGSSPTEDGKRPKRSSPNHFDESSDDDLSSSDESEDLKDNDYVAGWLDDPGMVFGRNKQVGFSRDLPMPNKDDH